VSSLVILNICGNFVMPHVDYINLREHREQHELVTCVNRWLA